MLGEFSLQTFRVPFQWPIQGAPPERAPKGPDSFILAYKFFET